MASQANQSQSRGSKAAQQQLSFKGKLYQKGMSTDSLLKRLKAIQQELSKLDQESVDTSSLDSLCSELVQPTLMIHKDKGVKALVACCLADMLRLYAPDAPFTASELKDIFYFFIHQLTDPQTPLVKQNAPNHAQALYLLESLSNVKTMALVCDLEDGDEMTVEVFRGFFDLIRPDLPKNVELCMADILVQLIDECTSVPPDVVEILLNNFTGKVVKLNPAANHLAIEVSDATKDRLQKYVAQHFGEVILSASRDEGAEARLSALTAVHSLIVHIHRSVPPLLLNVVPQLEEELKAEDFELRQIATKTLGLMFADKPTKTGAGGDLAQKYPSAWRAWLGRAKDKNATLRVSFVELTKNIITHHPEVRADLAPVMKEKLLDPDERVRAAMAKVFGALDYETALHNVDRDVLKELGTRVSDRKQSVRVEALTSLGSMYNTAFSEIESHDPAATRQFAWIPGQILEGLYAGVREADIAVAAAIEKYVVPLPRASAVDETAWVNRLLVVMKSLGGRHAKSLMQLSHLTMPRESPFDHFLKACEAYDGGLAEDDDGSKKQRLKALIMICATQLGDPVQSANHLQSLAQMRDATTMKCIQECFDPLADVAKITSNREKALRRIDANKSEITDTIGAFIRIGSYSILNRSSISPLLRRLQQSRAEYTASQRGEDTMRETFDTQNETATSSLRNLSDADSFSESAQALLTFMVKARPQLFASHVAELIKALGETGSPSLVALSLRALSALAVHKQAVITLDRKQLERIAKLVTAPSLPVVKYSTRLLAALSSSDASTTTQTVAKRIVEQLLEQLARALPKATQEHTVRHIQAFGQLFKYAPSESEDVSDSIVKHVLHNVLMRSDEESETLGDVDDWVEFSQISDNLRCKVLGLDILTKRTLAFKNDGNGGERGEKMARPLLNMLFTILKTGEAKPGNASRASKSRLRLTAGILLLKLGREPRFTTMIGPQFAMLTHAVQDECFQVRFYFIQRLMAFLSKGKLEPRYYALAFIVALDPEKENRENVMQIIKQRVAVMPPEVRFKHFEITFVRLIHLLAHHPDFERSVEVLKGFPAYIDFYLDCVATPKNVGLLFHLATRLKGVRDAESTGASENVYTLSELALLVIRRRAHQHNWSIESHVGGIKLPADIFKPLPSKEAQAEILSAQFLPEELVTFLEDSAVKQQPKKRNLRILNSPPPKRAKTKTAAAPKRKRRMGANSEDDSGGETSDDSLSDDSSKVVVRKAAAKKSPAAGKRQSKSPATKRRDARPLRKTRKAAQDEESDGADAEEEEDADADADAMDVEEEQENTPPTPIASAATGRAARSAVRTARAAA